jgi:WD40 repeat protein
VSASLDKTANVWDTVTWKLISRYTGHTNWIWTLDQVDNDTMVSGSVDYSFHLWQIRTGQVVKKVYVGVDTIAVKVLLNGLLACGCAGSINNLRIFNFTTGSWLNTLKGHTSNVNAIEVLSEQFIASGGDDTRVFIWDLKTYSSKYNLTGHTISVYCIKRLSSNLIASGDENGFIIVWNWSTGERTFNLNGHTNGLYLSSLDLYNEQTLISGSLDRTVKFWNITNGVLIRTLNADIQIDALVMLNSTSKNSLKYFWVKHKLRRKS